MQIAAVQTACRNTWPLCWLPRFVLTWSRFWAAHHLTLCTSASAGPAINHFQQVESKGAIFWEPLVLAIGVAEAYRVGRGWETPTSDKFYALRVSLL